MRNSFVAVLMAVSMAGCAGSRFSFDDARRVQVGMTTAEMQDIMGKPYRVTSTDGKEIWVWSYANGMTGGARSVSFTVKDGKVVGVPKIPDSF
jgi:hypothetical protein